MAKAKHAKPLTAKEKKWRAEARADMRARGLMPPVKKPLNRSKFIKEAREEYNGTDFGLSREFFLTLAISWTMQDYRPTPESVGIAKVLKVACEIKRFFTEVEKHEQKTYTDKELYERIKPILDA